MSAIPARFVETGSLWDRAPGLVSLRDLMEELRSDLAASVFAGLMQAVRVSEVNPPLAPMPQQVKDHFETYIFSRAEILCRKAGLPQSLAMLGRLRSEFARGMTAASAGQAIVQLQGLIINEFAECCLYVAPKDRVSFHDNERLFGDAVFEAFPSAQMDVREAGNCWLFGRNNAAVYHLMCAAEFGLRALARDRRVPEPKGPLELEQWGRIIRDLEPKVDAIENWPRSVVREQAKHFYNSALIEARAFNNGYRTHVMHARDHAYHDDEAQALMGHVRRFMQTLATKISETEITPEVWTSSEARPSC